HCCKQQCKADGISERMSPQMLAHQSKARALPASPHGHLTPVSTSLQTYPYHLIKSKLFSSPLKTREKEKSLVGCPYQQGNVCQSCSCRNLTKTLRPADGGISQPVPWQ